MIGRRYLAVDAEGTIDLLRDNLRDRYKDCFSIVQELLQNADDAKARHIHFGISKGLGVEDPMLGGAALFVVNDGPVSADDLNSIFRIAAGNKHGDKDKIGKFGLGMKSVFHVCEGFYMFGEGLECQAEFPCFCTPWSEEYHPNWWVKWESESRQAEEAVRQVVEPIVKDWDRWFCVWIPMRTKGQLVEQDGEALSPILQMFPLESREAFEAFVGVEYAERAARMLPLLKNVEHLSFGTDESSLRQYEIMPSNGRLRLANGSLGGEVVATGDGATGFRYCGESVLHAGESAFTQLQKSDCWPEKTHKEMLRGPVRIVDKTEPHAAVCLLLEHVDAGASITVRPCVFLPLSGVRDQAGRYSVSIDGNVSLTIYLHGSMFVDAGRQDFSLGESAVEQPTNETELRREWNRRLFVRGVLPLLIPELENLLEDKDVDTGIAASIMSGISAIPYFRHWMREICDEWSLVSEMTPDGYAWRKVSSADEICALSRPRSKVVNKVLCSVLPKNIHVIDEEAGRLSKAITSDLPNDVCERVLGYIAEMSAEESDNEILRQFAQDCASRLDFSSLPDHLQRAAIWKVGGERYSYRSLQGMKEGLRLYCHAEGDLKKIFDSAIAWDALQISEPLSQALKLNVPDFTEQFVLDVIQKKPPVASAEMRCPLLEKLLHKGGLRENPEWFKACRYLAHGERDLFDCEEPLFTPLQGDFAAISEKMVDALTKSQYGVCCHLPKSITEILTPADQEVLKLPMSSADHLLIAFSRLQSFAEVHFECDDWQSLVLMVPNLFETSESEAQAALKRIPAYPTLDGGLTALTERVFRVNESFAVPDELAGSIRLLKVGEEGRAFDRLSRLSTLWHPNDCVRVCDAENLDHSVRARIFKTSLAQFGEYISPDVEVILKKTAWVDLKDGRVVAPDDILAIGEMSDLVPACVTLSDVADGEVADLLKKHSLSVGASRSVELLFEQMARDAHGRFRIGCFEASDGTNKKIDALTLSKVLMGEGEAHLPAVSVLNRLNHQKIRYAEFVDKLRGRLSSEQLTATIQIVTAAIDFDEEEEWTKAKCDLLWSYLDEAARLENFGRGIVSRLKFFSRNRVLKHAKDLCFGVKGVPDKYILWDEYKNAAVFMSALRSTSPSRQGGGFDKQVSFADYFASWDAEFADRIGGFIVCCSDQPEDLSLSRDRYGFGSRSVEEARNGIAPGLHALLRNQHCYVLATPDESVDVVSISGEKMAVTTTPLSGASSLLCGHNTCEYVRNSVLEMSMGNPPMPKEDHSLILRLRKPDAATLQDLPQAKLDELFRNTLDEILASYPRDRIQNPATGQFWESLKHSEQLAVRVTKSIILQSLNTYLPMLNCRDEKLRCTFEEWHQLDYSMEEAKQHGNAAKVSSYRDKCATLQKDLERRIVEDPTLGESILQALRTKMRDYQYDIDSMLFELFQNADDATEELHALYDADAPTLPDRFCVRFDGHNLVVAHWGRPINQTKVGGRNAGQASYRADLQKMLMLSQSGKGNAGVKVSGKFGLGFKTVFFVCDIPCVVSGKLRFKILGGLLPEALEENEEAQVRELTAEFDRAESPVRPTVFVLPLRKDIREKVADAVARFKKQINVLSAFSRRIKDISVIASDGVEVRAEKEREAGLFVLRVADAKLLIGERDGMLEAVDKDVATYWVTAPTEMRAGLGVSLNADFDLDTGRSYLNLRSEKNARLIPQIAEEIHTEMIRRFDAMPEVERKKFFGRLFEILAGRERLENWRDDGSHAAADAMRAVLWNPESGAYLRLLRERPTLPSGLPGSLDVLCRLGDIEQMVCNAIADSDLARLLPLANLIPGKVVYESHLMRQGEMFFPEVVRVVPLYTFGMLLSDVRKSMAFATPDWCAGEDAEIILSSLDGADETVQKELRQFEFKTEAGDHRCATELLINDENEGRKAAFMPPEYVLSSEYDGQGIAFAKRCRGEHRIKPRVLAIQAASADDMKRQEAVLDYLANGDPSDEFKNALRELKDDSWLSGWQTSVAARDLSRRDRDRVTDALSASDADYELSIGASAATYSAMTSSVPRPPISVRDVRDWWRQHAEEELRDYNNELYGRSDVVDLSFNLALPGMRKEWMEVLVLGAAHALGMKKCQHRGFIAELKSRGYWDVYCKEDLRPAEWLDTIDGFLENEELDGGKYSYWMRLFFRIYQFSKNLDGYVSLFQSWKCAKSCGESDLATIKTNPKLSGSGVDLPGLQKALPRTGLHFVFREMVRRHAIDNPVIYPQCFVPYESVSAVAWNMRSSEAIYRKVVLKIGERDASFGGAFDIALTQYDKHGRKEGL